LDNSTLIETNFYLSVENGILNHYFSDDKNFYSGSQSKMDLLWAPWRMQYIQAIEKDDGCIFCTKPSQSEDKKNLILYRGKSCFVLMNLYPYNNGHLMVIPYHHTSDIAMLDRETSCEMWDLICLSRKVLSAAIRPDAFNIGMNIGRVAGAGIDQHLRDLRLFHPHPMYSSAVSSPAPCCYSALRKAL
jgi:ATP adenylyltransferase